MPASRSTTFGGRWLPRDRNSHLSRGQRHLGRSRNLVLIYSDAVIEADNSDGEPLGSQGLLEQVSSLDVSCQETFCHALLGAIASYRNNAPVEDDVTVLLLHHNGGRPPSQSIGEMIKVMGKMLGLVKV